MSAKNDVILSGNHPTTVLNKMKLLRERSVLCDITLKISDTEIPAHKVVLATCSPFFEFMFTGNVAESNKQLIAIRGLCPKAFLTVLNFMYSGYLVVNEETMLEVLKVTDFLKISIAKEKCLEYVQKHIKISNCTLIRDIAKKYYFTQLEAKVNIFIENNFVEFINTECFFRLSIDEVKAIITEHSSYTNNALYEKAISNWIDYEKSSREELKNDLLGTFKVHIQNLAQRGLNVHDSFLEKRIYVMSREASAHKVWCLDLKNFQWNCVCDRPRFESIPPIFHDQSIYVVSNDKCGRLNLEFDEWDIKMMPFSNYTVGCSMPNGIFLVTKGPLKGTFSYNTETNVVYPEKHLIFERSHPGVVFSDNCIYVCGGGSASAERRDIRTQVWRPISNVPTSRDECSATSLHDRIFIASVSSGKFAEFDKRKGVWITKKEIPKSDKSSFTLGSTDEAVYSFNGRDILQYNMNSDEWKIVGSASSVTTFVCVYPR